MHVKKNKFVCSKTKVDWANLVVNTEAHTCAGPQKWETGDRLARAEESVETFHSTISCVLLIIRSVTN